MSANMVRAAIEARNPGSIANYLTHYRRPEDQARVLFEVMVDSTVAELKALHRWAEDWLSDRTNDALRRSGDARWQAVNSVYLIAGQALRASGTVRSVEIQP